MKGKVFSVATIKENRRNGKIVSYYFTACLGRDEQGRQIRQYLTWTLPKGVGQKTARKEAEKQAAFWEEGFPKAIQEQMGAGHMPNSFRSMTSTSSAE